VNCIGNQKLSIFADGYHNLKLNHKIIPHEENSIRPGSGVFHYPDFWTEKCPANSI
jgi:hypothetical protein